MKKQIRHILLTCLIIVYASCIYFLFFRKPSIVLYCKKMVNSRIYNFHQAIKGNGAPLELEDNPSIQNAINTMYKNCLKNKR